MDQPALRKADRVADDLMRRIVRGDLTVGSLLPKESELALSYGVNRSVVREAIKLLEVHRLVQPRRRRGTQVLDPLGSLSPEVLRSMLSPQPGIIDCALFADLLEIRAQLDLQMSTLAAERRTESDVVALQACHEAMRAARTDAQQYADAASDLALAMARATGNRIFQMLVQWHERVHTDLADVMRVVRQPSDAHLQGEQHLIDCVRRRDVAGAHDLVAAFHRWATPRLLAAAALRTGRPLAEIAGGSP